MTQVSRKKSFANFLEAARIRYGNKFTYFIETYRNYTSKTKISCPVHNIFFQTPNQHLNGRKGNVGCPKCGIHNRTQQKRTTLENFIQKSHLIHNYKYDYSKAIYVNRVTKILIICPVHGKFYQRPAEHLALSGCPKCSIEERTKLKTKNRTDFIHKANIIHNNKYNYDKVIYLKGRNKVIITCPQHGDFYQTPEGHLSGRGCVKCIGFVSRKETIWLNQLGIQPEHRNCTITLLDGTKTRVDAYVPETNTVYEFHGDYWHGNPNKYDPNKINKRAKQTFGQLYLKTKIKEQKIIESGYPLVVMWESDYQRIRGK